VNHEFLYVINLTSQEEKRKRREREEKEKRQELMLRLQSLLFFRGLSFQS